MWHLQKTHFLYTFFFRNAEFGIQNSDFGIQNSEFGIEKFDEPLNIGHIIRRIYPSVTNIYIVINYLKSLHTLISFKDKGQIH